MGLLDWLTFSSKTNEQTQEEAKKNLNKSIIKYALSRIKQDTLTWREAVQEAERAYFPYRVKMQQMYIDTKLNGHVIACLDKRRGLSLLRDYDFLNAKGEIDEKTTLMLKKDWFDRILYLSFDAIIYGYNLISLGDVKDGEFKNINVVKRWNISPDREIVSRLIYTPEGTKFLEDEEIKKFHLWVTTPNDLGTSNCGYGLLYEVAVYEIFLRNILGYNGDFVELFSQPFRIGKTDKTEEDERRLFEEAVRDMGSSGYAVLDSLGTETIEFVSADNSSNGFLGYENFENRLEKKISKIILGHADAIDSTSGKLGSSNDENSPAEIAMREKQAVDGKFLENVINFELFPRLRSLGFNIPQETKFKFKNNKEKEERNFTTAKLGEQMKKAGFQMDKDYFEETTGIKTADIATPSIEPNPQSNLVNKLKAINALYKG